jgi:acyl-CoA synthetase (AMP-forming)/AMP-acid ligase II
MRTLSSELLRHYQERPDQPAVTLLSSTKPDLHLTYRDLFQASSGYANNLKSAGIAPGEVVILILNHGPALIESFFGAVLHGAIPSIMPFLTEKLDPGHYRQSLAALIAITRPTAVITYPEFYAEVSQAAGVSSSLRAILVDSDSQTEPQPDLPGLEGLLRRPDDIALLQHSSGSTGLQKGVALSHQAVFNQLDSYARSLCLLSQDRVVSWLPLYHDMGLIAGFLLPVLCGLRLVLLSPFDWVRSPARLLQAISHYRGSLVWLPNFAYNFSTQKIRDRDLAGIDLSSLRAVINCSEPMVYRSQQMFVERFTPFGLRSSALATCYAMAENVFAVSQGGIEAPVNIDWIDLQALAVKKKAVPTLPGNRALPMVSAGPPLDNTQVCVLSDDSQELPPRNIGELALRSNCMLTGYYQRPDLTEKAFRDGWYLTGDMGYLADGEVYITGRKKDLIIVGGKNIYPQDLENIANETPGVHPGRVVAFGVFSEQTGTEDIVMIAETDELDIREQQRIGDALRQRVTQGSDIALRYVYIVGRDWLLKTSSGKIARTANREKYLQEINEISE